MSTPIVGITMGDAAGVGPEIIMKALADRAMYELCHPLVIGDAKMLERAERAVRSGLSVRRIAKVADAAFAHGQVDCLDLDLLPPDLPLGQVSG
ncbi:MAG: 4-hydroxythreonine-4-phosphate dehydrogenase PdxA, partial [Chloroflexota bacterium]|nr:4-hydroxythreonine-4-phosphate dehydrogenase PdxA [Chloroflexota bacterium]